MTSATGVRIGWADLPVHVREAVERSLDAQVVAAVSQPGGFSPGTADRVVTANGQRAFVKAVSGDLNEGSVVLHRREARVAAALPSEAPAPRLLACHDDGCTAASNASSGSECDRQASTSNVGHPPSCGASRNRYSRVEPFALRRELTDRRRERGVDRDRAGC